MRIAVCAPVGLALFQRFDAAVTFGDIVQLFSRTMSKAKSKLYSTVNFGLGRG